MAVAARLQRQTLEEDRLSAQELLTSTFHNLKWAVKDSVTKADWIDLELYQHIVKKVCIFIESLLAINKALTRFTRGANK